VKGKRGPIFPLLQNDRVNVWTRAMIFVPTNNNDGSGSF
jgi:hypothetical protein